MAQVSLPKRNYNNSSMRLIAISDAGQFVLSREGSTGICTLITWIPPSYYTDAQETKLFNIKSLLNHTVLFFEEGIFNNSKILGIDETYHKMPKVAAEEVVLLAASVHFEND